MQRRVRHWADGDEALELRADRHLQALLDLRLRRLAGRTLRGNGRRRRRRRGRSFQCGRGRGLIMRKR